LCPLSSNCYPFVAHPYIKKRKNKNIVSVFQSLLSVYKKEFIHMHLPSILCQVLSNRYFPKTQTDQRTIIIPTRADYYSWDWYQYSKEWDAKKVLAQMKIDAKQVKRIHQNIITSLQHLDPLERWYSLVKFVSIEKKSGG